MTTLRAISSPGFDFGPSTVAVLLHGYGSTEQDLVGLATYLPTGLPWVSVRAPLRHPSTGYAWYPLTPGAFAADNGVAEATRVLWSWIEDNLPPTCTLVPLGFSQGGLMATQLLRTRPDRVAAAVVLSGFVADAPQPADGVLGEVRRPVFWGRGETDAMVPAPLVAAAGRWLEEHTELERHVYPGLGHSVNDAELADVRVFLAEALEGLRG